MRFLYKNIIGAVIALAAIAFIFSLLYSSSPAASVLSLNDLVEKINRGDVQKITVEGNQLAIELAGGITATAQKEAEAGLTETLKNYGVEAAALQRVAIIVQDESGTRFWAGILIPALLPIL